MSWLKLSDDFSDDTARAGLSDAAFRTHVEGLNWVMRRETAGRLDMLDVRRFADTADPAAAITELVNAGFWKDAPGGWQIIHHMEHQPEPEVIDKRRELNAARQAKHRRKRAGLSGEPEPAKDSNGLRNALRNPLNDALPGTGRDGTGRENHSLDIETQNETGISSAAASVWPKVAQPGSGKTPPADDLWERGVER